MRMLGFLVVLWAIGSVAWAESAHAQHTTAANRAQCPGRPLPPIECAKVICRVGDGAWDYTPLPAGTVCQGTGVCDGQMTCVLPQPVQTLAIPSDTLNVLILGFLQGTTLSVDATGSAPPLILGYSYECTEGPGPIGEICVEIPEITHSYIRFSDMLKARYAADTGGRQLRDHGFYVGTACASGLCATINQLHADLGDARVLFGQAAGGAYAKLLLPLQSASPTLILDAGLFPVPDLDLTDMQISLYLTLLPVSDSSGQAALMASDVQALFEFDSNLTYFPDWLVGAFYDVDSVIRETLKDRVRESFVDQNRRQALSNALTKAITAYAQQQHSGFTGFKTIHYVYASAGTLFIDYVPQ
jgi:hypothetical protein